MKGLRTLKKWVSDYNGAKQLGEDLEVLYEFYKAGEAIEVDLERTHQQLLASLEDIEFRNMLSEEGDELSAVLQITAGAGGTESCDWAEMLMRMYLMWVEKQGFKIKELNHQARHRTRSETNCVGFSTNSVMAFVASSCTTP